MTPKTDDLEIYLLKADPDAIRDWLTGHLGELQQTELENGGRRWQTDNTSILFTPRADGNFDCLWFKQNTTPWQDDLDCARSAHAALEREVRCAARLWSESENDDQRGWIKLTRGQEKSFNWE